MNLRTVTFLTLAGLCLANAAAQPTPTPIKKGVPAFSVQYGSRKNEIYYLDDLKANIDRLDKTWTAQLPASLNADEREKARMEILSSAKLKLVDAQISSILFRQFCEGEGITVVDQDVAKYIASLKLQLGAQEESDAALETYIAASQGMILDLKTYARGRLLQRKYIQTKRAEELKAIRPPTRDEVTAAYEQMKPSLLRPETARVSVIFINAKGKSPEELKKAQAKMEQLAAKIKDDKSQFDELVLAAYDPSAGYLAKGSIVVENLKGAGSMHSPAFVDAVFALEKGEISGVLKNEEGFQIVRLNETIPSKQLTLLDPVPGEENSSIQDLIIEQLVGMAQERLAAKIQADKMESLRGEATVTIMKDNLRGFLSDDELDSLAKRYAKKAKK